MFFNVFQCFSISFNIFQCLNVTLQTRAPKNFMSMGAERRVSRAQTREQGPPLAWAEFWLYFFLLLLSRRNYSPRRVVLIHQNIRIPTPKNIRDPPLFSPYVEKAMERGSNIPRNYLRMTELFWRILILAPLALCKFRLNHFWQSKHLLPDSYFH